MGHFLFSPVSDFKKTRESQRRERAQRKKMYRAKQTARKEVTPRSSAFQFSARNDFSASASSHHSYEKKQTARKSIGPKKFPREETICHSRAYSEKPPSFDCDAYLQPTIVEPPPTKKRKREAPTTKQAAPKKPTPFEFNPDSLPRLTPSMSLTALKEEAKARDQYSGKSSWSKDRLVNFLGEGSIMLSYTQCYVDYKYVLQLAANEAKGFEEKKKLNEREEEKTKQECFHIHSFPPIHPHPLALTERLTIGERPRKHKATCNYVDRTFTCHSAKYTCEKCDFDICEVCLEKRLFKSLPKEERNKIEEERKRIEEEREKERERRRKLMEEERKRMKKVMEEQRERERKEREEKLKEFTPLVQSPPSKNTDHINPLSYVVFRANESYRGEPTVDFDSSFTNVEDANSRAKFIFLYEDEGDGPIFESVSGKLHLYKREYDYQESAVIVTGVIEKETYLRFTNNYGGQKYIDSEKDVPSEKKYAAKYKKLAAANRNEAKLLKYVVYTKSGYPSDGWHSYSAPTYQFDSSFATKQEANKRAEFKFFYENLWGVHPSELDSEEPMTLSVVSGLNRYEVCPPDSEKFIVSVCEKDSFPAIKAYAGETSDFEEVSEEEEESDEENECYIVNESFSGNKYNFF